MLRLDAPIVPGVGAAGLTLGDDVAQLLALRTTPFSAATLPGTGRTRHDFGPISIWEARGRVEQIRLSDGYVGVLDGIIGIGTTIAEVECHFGRPVEEDEDDNLVVQAWTAGASKRRPGLRVPEHPERIHLLGSPSCSCSVSLARRRAALLPPTRSHHIWFWRINLHCTSSR